MTPIDIELFPVLIAFQEAKNLVTAAEKLKISQPAVTQRLQRLQEQVSQPLYAFEGRKKVLTRYGKALYETAKKNLSQLQIDLENLDRRFASPSQLVLRVGGQKELVGLFIDLLEFTGTIDHRQMSEGEAREALEAEVIDIAFSKTVIDTTDLMSRKFFESSSHIVFHQKWLKSIQSLESLKEDSAPLQKIPCVIHRIENTYVERFCKGIKMDSSQLNCKAVLEDWSSILDFIEAEKGFAIVPGFIRPSSSAIRDIDVPHSMIPRSVYYAVFQRKLKSMDSFKKILSFVIRDS